MADESDAPAGGEPPPPEDPVTAIHAFEPPVAAGPPSFSASAPSFTPPAAGVPERPEVAIGAAFAGGFVVAMLLKRLGS